MPDFVSKRKEDRKRLVKSPGRKPLSISPVATPRTKQSKRGPLATLRKLARDFRSGISALQRMAYEKAAVSGKQRPAEKSSTVEHRKFITREHVKDYTPSAMSAAGRERLYRANEASRQAPRPVTLPEQHTSRSPRPVTLPERNTVKSSKKTEGRRTEVVRERTQRLRDDRKPEHPIRPPAISRSYRAFKRPLQRPSGARGEGARQGVFAYGRQGIVTSADREAAQQVHEPYTGAFHQLPAAARVAQVIRADALIRSGEGKEHPTIRALAQAAREGRKRYVADADPVHLQQAFNEAFGGATRAEQVLSTPVIHNMVERHRFAVESVQRRLETISRREAPGRVPNTGSGTVSVRRGRGSGVRRSASPPRLASPSASSLHHTPGGDERTHVHELRAQLSHNDFGHLPSAADQAEREERLRSTSPSIYASKQVRTAETKKSDRRVTPPQMPQSESGRPSMPAPTRVSKAPASANQQRSQDAKPKQNKFTGELRMVSSTGKDIGRAEVEMKGG